MSGSVVSIKNGVVKLKTSFAEMPVPLKNVTQMSFSSENQERARRNSGDVKAYFAGGSQLTFELKSIKDNKIHASSENFGTSTLDLNVFIGLERCVASGVG